MPAKRPLSPDTTASQSAKKPPSQNIFISSPIEDRSSTFVAYYSSVSIPAKTLQAHTDLRTADHRIAAWRRPSPQQTLSIGSKPRQIYTTGSDDDGEKYAGKKVEKVLNDLNAEGVIVVARWYGGVLLGPVRFTHIEDVAREAIRLSRGQTSSQSSSYAQPETKKLKTDAPAIDSADTAEQLRRLAKQLLDRDRSIVTLRQLLADKQNTTKAAKSGTEPGLGSQEQQQITPSPQSPDYASMPLPRLKQLDKARDATISFLLKRIDATEGLASTKKDDG